MNLKNKIITSVFITLSLVLMCYLQSYATNQQLAHKYNQKVECYDFTKQIQ